MSTLRWTTWWAGCLRCLLVAVSCGISPARAADSVDSTEMAATLRDMIALPRVQTAFAARMVVPHEEFAAAFDPQSAWGRNLLDIWAREWRENLDRLALGLKRCGELDAALSPVGVRIPVLDRIAEETPELDAVAGLMNDVQATPCMPESEPARCFIVLRLGRDGMGRVMLRQLRVVDTEGMPMRFPGKSPEALP